MFDGNISRSSSRRHPTCLFPFGLFRFGSECHGEFACFVDGKFNRSLRQGGGAAVVAVLCLYGSRHGFGSTTGRHGFLFFHFMQSVETTRFGQRGIQKCIVRLFIVSDDHLFGWSGECFHRPLIAFCHDLFIAGSRFLFRGRR